MPENLTELPRKTGHGLPVVTQDTILGLFQSAETGSQRWGERLEEVKARLVKEQPALAEFLESQVGKFPPEIHDALFEIGVGIYSVLEQEANSSRLSAIFKMSGEGKEGE